MKPSIVNEKHTSNWRRPLASLATALLAFSGLALMNSDRVHPLRPSLSNAKTKYEPEYSSQDQTINIGDALMAKRMTCKKIGETVFGTVGNGMVFQIALSPSNNKDKVHELTFREVQPETYQIENGAGEYRPVSYQEIQNNPEKFRLVIQLDKNKYFQAKFVAETQQGSSNNGSVIVEASCVTETQLQN